MSETLLNGVNPEKVHYGKKAIEIVNEKIQKKEIRITRNCNSGQYYKFGLSYTITCDCIRGIFLMFII